ncbi:hypothetical protein HZA87_04335 [Candidatus Uhrbacteria bacterium]|nr:hypothetical protein [Candidatus Uhrbacteria bacterium]
MPPTAPSLQSLYEESPSSQATHHLHSFPDEARAQIGTEGESRHISNLLPETGACVLVTVHDLVDDARGIRRVVDKVGSPKQVFAATCSQPSYGETFRTSIDWAKKIGHAGEVILVSHELAALLGAQAHHGRLRNGIVIVHDGKIVWSKMADVHRPNTPHLTGSDFDEAFDRYNR